ncbi:MAG: hypothetical protein R2764_10785 [Bacteroidales bacterium]
MFNFLQIATLCFFVLNANSIWAQDIPNGDFEDWSISKAGIEFPEKWEALNEEGMIYIEKTEGHSGGQAACLNVVWDQMIQSFTGAILRSDEEIILNTRISSLNGYYLTKAATTDTLQIEIEVYAKGNPVGEGDAGFCKNSHGWMEFSIPIKYYSPEVPDHAEIVIYINPSKGGLHLSRYCVDDLMFEN